MRRIAIIVGTRPQIIKTAPIVKVLERIGEPEFIIVNTGQHYDYQMNRLFFEELELPEPSINLEIGPGTPNEQIARIIDGIGRKLPLSKPDIAVIPGDTNSALGAAIACSKSQIKIAHLESGCRSYDLRMSEEINRRVIDHISEVLLCPTSACFENLKSEKVPAFVIENIGDTMLDSILQWSKLIDDSPVMQKYRLMAGSYVFMTLHRAENVDVETNLASIIRAVGKLEVPIVFPVHPRTKGKLAQLGINVSKNIVTIEPVSYFDSLRLIRGASFVITDSGGVQKEAYWMKRPALILREQTEWMEIVKTGNSILVGNNFENIRQATEMIKNINEKAFDETLFGDGHAAEKAVSVITNYVH